MDDPWEDLHYVPQNVPQWRQATDLTRGFNARRTSCDEKATDFFGAWDMYFVGYCPKHWARFKTMVEEELYSAPLDHWMVEAVLKRGARVLIEEEAERQGEIERLEREAERDARFEAKAKRLEARMGFTGGVVYFIQQGDAGPIKIGTTRKLTSRFDALQTSSPYTLYLRAAQPGDATTEREYHRMFAAHRLSGEWFEPVEEILDVIAQIVAGTAEAPKPTARDSLF